MSNNINNCIEKLKYISTIKDKKLRCKILESIADDCLYKALWEIVRNHKQGNIKLDKGQRQKLNKYNKILKKFNIKINNKSKRKKLIKQSGGFWPYLIPIALQTISSLINQ